MNKPKAIVVGAGIGGLVAAIDLATRGLEVSLFEQTEQPGGKMRAVEIEGHRIDSGPTVFTMPWVFETLFADAGSNIHEHLCLRPAELLARHAWLDGGQLDLFADLDQSAAAIAALSGREEAQRYRTFCASARRVYQTLYEPFMCSQRPTLGSLIKSSGLRGLIDLWHIRPFETLWRRLGKSFHDPRLRNLFARYATYCGSSPLQAPATLMLIAHVERCGVWQVEGGMRALADALAALLTSKGGTIHYGSTISDVELQGRHASGVRLSSGERLSADVVVVNADVASIQHGLLGQAARSALPAPAPNTRAPNKRSLSAVTWSLLAETSGFELAHHNVFFPRDYPEEFSEIFSHGRLPANPAVYVCAQDRGSGCNSPGRPERLFLITNAPASGDCDGDGNGDREGERFQPAAISTLQSAAFGLLKDCGLTIEARDEHRVVTTPADFESRFPGTGGALYGSAAHGWRSSFTRPGSRSRIPGLYLAGGSVHPGPGVPMVALSGRLAAEAVANDLGLSPQP